MTAVHIALCLIIGLLCAVSVFQYVMKKPEPDPDLDLVYMASPTRQETREAVMVRIREKLKKQTQVKLKNVTLQMKTLADQVHSPPSDVIYGDSIVIAGCCRDIHRFAFANLKRLIRISKHFSTCSFVFFENDSSDDTLTFLQSFEQAVNNNRSGGGVVTVLHEDALTKRFRSRTARLAYARNRLKNWALSNAAEYQYYLNVDMDEVIGYDSIEKTFDECFQPKMDVSLGWVAQFPYSDHYYDWWAYRDNVVCSYDVHGESWLLPRGELPELCSQLKKRVETSPTPYLVVDSAFNGAGLYKMQALRSSHATYIGSQTIIDTQGNPMYREYCEHVPFHLQLNESFPDQLIINSKWKV